MKYHVLHISRTCISNVSFQLYPSYVQFFFLLFKWLDDEVEYLSAKGILLNGIFWKAQQNLLQILVSIKQCTISKYTLSCSLDKLKG